MHVYKSSTYDDSIPLDLVERRLLFDDDVLALESALLLAEAAFQNGVGSEDLKDRYGC